MEEIRRTSWYGKCPIICRVVSRISSVNSTIGVTELEKIYWYSLEV